MCMFSSFEKYLYFNCRKLGLSLVIIEKMQLGKAITFLIKPPIQEMFTGLCGFLSANFSLVTNLVNYFKI